MLCPTWQNLPVPQGAAQGPHPWLGGWVHGLYLDLANFGPVQLLHLPGGISGITSEGKLFTVFKL